MSENVEVLYRRFRPKKFIDVIGQDHITSILKRQIEKNKIAHAYLFIGTRGTGKTTCAKILAKAVNCTHPINGEPCGQCDSCKNIEIGACTDVIEMDAASNNSVDDIRKIIEQCKYSMDAKYRVYIIDECHMLSNGAVNALLKTLEEPPKNVIFILATTDPQKLLPTIISRCQKHEFRRIRIETIEKQLRYVSNSTKININDKCISLIAKIADGGMRDALSILEQAQSLDKGDGVSYKELLDVLGAASSETMFNLTENIINGKKIESLNIINELDKSGKDFTIFIKEYQKFIRHMLMVKVMGKKEAINVVPLGEEDIEKLSNLSQNCTSEQLLQYIEVLQKTEESIKGTTQSRICVELAAIKMANMTTIKITEEIKTKQEDKKVTSVEENKTVLTEVIKENNNENTNITKESVKPEVNEVKQKASINNSSVENISIDVAKKKVAKAYEDGGYIEESLKIYKTPVIYENNKIILCSIPEDEKLLQEHITGIKQRFKKYLNNLNLEVEIEVNKNMLQN